MKILHAGCGNEPLPDWFANCEETRLDIDPSMKADVVANLTDMGDIGPFDSAYSSHCLEHLYPHDVGVAMSEFHRVLRPGGMLMIIVPDLEDVKPTEDVVYVSPGGPVSGLDMFYGAARLIPTWPYMAHHCGFVAHTLESVFRSAGFVKITTKRMSGFHLMAVGLKEQ